MKQKKPPKSFEKRVKAIGYLHYIRYRIKFFILMWKIKSTRKDMMAFSESVVKVKDLNGRR